MCFCCLCFVCAGSGSESHALDTLWSLLTVNAVAVWWISALSPFSAMNIIPVPFLLSPGPVSIQVGSRIRGWSHPVSSVFVFAQPGLYLR